jgi:hypothetical protein
METITTIFEWLGYPATIIAIGAGIWAIVLWARGITPVLIRLGNGLAKRKIAVFAQGDTLASLEALLNDCKLFGKANIISIGTAGDIRKAENASVYLLNWMDFRDHIDEILHLKKDQTPLVVHAPPGAIPQDQMVKLANARNVAVCNFRGRLLNDLVTSMITTSY